MSLRMRSVLVCAAAACLSSGHLVGQSRVPAAAADAAFAAFWEAADPDTAHAASAAILDSGITFADAFARLRTGRPYSRHVPTGVVLDSRHGDGEEFFYSVDVPPTYDPGRRYRVRVQLHGGVGAGEDNRRRGTGAIGGMAGDEQIYIIPTAWLDVPWWSEKQLRNLRAILDRVKRTYNIDENGVVVSGVSDGGTASYYIAMRDTTPYASFLPLIGSLMQLAGRTLNLDDVYPNNLLNKPFFVVNTGRDLLYPTRDIDPVIRNLQRAGVRVEYRPRPDGEHDVAWWPAVRPEFERFANGRPRVAYPDVLTWQSGQGDRFNRAHWLVIDEVAETADTKLPDVNQIPTPKALVFGMLTSGARVTRVIPNSDAAALGLRNRDVIVAINGDPVGADADLDLVFGTCCPAGAAVAVTVSRGNERVLLEGTIGGRTLYGDNVPLFPRRRPSGRVDLVKSGNTVRAATSGVAAFTLLLSPDAFDFRQPVTVIANGQVVHDRGVVPSLATLLRWAAADNDREMLFGAELRVRLR